MGHSQSAGAERLQKAQVAAAGRALELVFIAICGPSRVNRGTEAMYRRRHRRIRIL
jgi:hypothetical protein